MLGFVFSSSFLSKLVEFRGEVSGCFSRNVISETSLDPGYLVVGWNWPKKKEDSPREVST